jgi:hypothetical protein
MNVRVEYELKGYVYGETWGGHYGFYKAITLYGNNLNQIIKKASKDLDILDSGMGFEKITGAIYFPLKIEIININGKEYRNTESLDEIIIGYIDKKGLKYFYDHYDDFVLNL